MEATLHVRRAHPVDGQLHAGEVGGEVAIERAVVEEQVVAQTGAIPRAGRRSAARTGRRVPSWSSSDLALAAAAVRQDHAVRL